MKTMALRRANGFASASPKVVAIAASGASAGPCQVTDSDALASVNDVHTVGESLLVHIKEKQIPLTLNQQ